MIDDLEEIENERIRKEARIIRRRVEEEAAKKEKEAVDAAIAAAVVAEVVDGESAAELVDSKIVNLPDDEEFLVDTEDDDTEDLRQYLTNALLLLHDCNNLFIAISDPLLHGRVPYHLGQEILRMSGEATLFLQDHELGLQEAQDLVDQEVIDDATFNIYD